MKNQRLMRHAAIVGLVVVVLYIACLLWKLTMTDPAVVNFHLLALKTAFPGFGGYDLASMLWGGILSFAYGFLASLLFHALHKNCCEVK